MGRVGKVAWEWDGCEDKLAAALDDEAGEPCPGVGSTEFDDGEVAVELLPGVGEDASACVCFVASVFSAIGTCVALCDDTLGGLGDGMCAIGGRWRGGGGVGREETFGLFETFPCRGEVLSQELGVAVAGGEELGELSVGLCGPVWRRGRWRHVGRLWGGRHLGGGRIVFYGVDKVSGEPADERDQVRPAFPPRDTQRWRGRSRVRTPVTAYIPTARLMAAVRTSPSPHLLFYNNGSHPRAAHVDRAHVVACFPS